MKDVFVYSCVGFIFGTGLIVSGMVSRSKIVHFLKFDRNWDPSLLIVFVCAVAINLIFFQIIIRYKKTPVLDSELRFPTNTKIDVKLVIGSICFGLGWGFSGFCPGPVLMNIVFVTPHINLFFIFSMFIGQSFAVGIQKISERKTDSRYLIVNKINSIGFIMCK